MSRRIECDRCSGTSRLVSDERAPRGWGVLTLAVEGASGRQIEVCLGCVSAAEKFMARLPQAAEKAAL